MLASLKRPGSAAQTRADPIVGTLTQLAADAAQRGASAVFLGHPDEQHYEFLAQGSRYAGRLNPRFTEQVRAFLRERGLVRLNSHLPALQAGLTGNGERQIVCLSWSNDLESEQEPAREEAVRPTLLLIEDDRRFAGVLEGVLLRQGYRVQIRESCQAAFDDLNRDTLRVDLILCDLHTPEMSGATFIRRMRSLGNRTPIVALTGDTDEGVEARLILLGASAFVRKQDDPRVLLAWCSSLLGFREEETE